MDFNIWAPKQPRRKLAVEYGISPSNDASSIKKVEKAMSDKSNLNNIYSY